MTRTSLFAIAFVSLATLSATAQESDPFAPAEKLADGWEQMDQRLIFLMVRLVDVEANLEAIDKAMGKSKSRAAIATGQADRAQAGNQRMDSRAGGPVRWDKFYGTTAEKFFYHPTDNHTYHTRTILSHQSPGRDNQTEPGVPSRQGLPVHQRPPQFDYMYRANETAKQRAEANVAKFRGNAAALAARRHELDLEQSKLWCEVAFRAVARKDLDRKALYRFAPSGSGKEDLLAATTFVTTSLSIVENGQKDQSSTFRQVKPLISKARYELGNKWLQLGVNYRDESKDEWKFAALARRLEDVSANLADSYTVSVEREGAGDNERRDLYRGLLQQALIQYAETVLALDEMASEMAKTSEFKPDLDKPVAEAKWVVAASNASSGPVAEAKPNEAVSLIRGDSLDGWYPEPWSNNPQWEVKNGVLKRIGVGPSLVTHEKFKNFDLHLEFSLPAKCNSGVFLRGRYEVQLLDSQFRLPNGKPLKPTQQCGSIYGLIAPSKAPYMGPSQWNILDVRLEERTVTVRINDVTVIDNKNIQSPTSGYFDKGDENSSGPLLLQAHKGIGAEFRNITVTPIP